MDPTPTRRVLVVDDEPSLLIALCQLLQQAGYEASGVGSATAAVEAYRASRFDIVLTDLRMPAIDGISLIRTLLEIDPDAVAILMTGHGTISTAVEALKSGALDYVLKPFKFSTMQPVLERALSVRRLRLQNAALARQVAGRTAELEEKNRELIFANNELEAFTRSVSHDLRSPLRTIRGFSTLLMTDFGSTLPSEAREHVDMISAEVDRMGRLIDDLLRFAHVGRQPLAKEPMDIREIVQAVLGELRHQETGRDVTVELHDLPQAWGDPPLVRQVFFNLISNAFKFTRKQQQPRIEIGGVIQGTECMYFVRDNGAGFDMRDVERLFGLFQRLHPSKQFEGTGVGLTIVQRIVERHGGRVWAEGEPGQGATFRFTLPGAAPSQSGP
jgi:two-component system sensor histidine kinase/response regulator